MLSSPGMCLNWYIPIINTIGDVARILFHWGCRKGHPKLLYKLTHLLKNNHIINWLKAYLSEHHCLFVSHKGNDRIIITTNWRSTGSVLRPPFLILFIGDMNRSFDLMITVKHFPDNVISYDASYIDDQDNLNRHLQNVTKWCADR